jgi:alkylation response protein AidB-like acyl-CoA dehydrogenase
MTALRPGTDVAATVLERTRELRPAIAERAPEIEAAGRLPQDLLSELIDAGCFRMLLPASHGGLSADLSDAMRIYENLARADASVGWTVMIGSGSWVDLVGLPRASFDALFADEHDTIFAGVFNPSGSVEPVDGGYRVTGRWAFASGCEHATWVFGNCMEIGPGGEPQLRVAVFPRVDVTIEDTWKVSGLCGTGSHHFSVRDVFVPTNRTAAVLTDGPCIDETIVHAPPPALFSHVIASVAIGIAQGALDDIVALAANKVPLLSPTTLAASPTFQVQLATADTDLRAARALLYETAASTWDAARAEQEFTLEREARIRAMAVWVVNTATAVVDAAYSAGGGRSIYLDCPLQRRFRDIHALTQHFLVRPDTLATAGAILGGEDVDVMVF